MSLHPADGQAWPLTIAVLVAVAVLGLVARAIVSRTSGAVLAAGVGALGCTAYSGDTSWRFAEHRLGMAQVDERALLFATGELALLACMAMARANKRATAVDGGAGTPGVPGVLVWCITGVQVIPAYSESGFIGGTVRAVIGPIMAGLLWHLAMGLEIRLRKPEALSTGLPAQIAHELRERLLSYLGLAVRGRDAAQLTADRAIARAVRLASRRHLGMWGRAALKASVARSGAAVDDEQRALLLAELAGRRTALQLREIRIDSPWTPGTVPVPEGVPAAPYPGAPAVLEAAELERLDPFDAVHQVHAMHPTLTPGELVAVCAKYGVPVGEDEVRIALNAPRVQASAAVPSVPDRPRLAAVPAPGDAPVPEYTAVDVQGGGLRLDLESEAQVRPEYRCAVPAVEVGEDRTRRQATAGVPGDLGELGFIWSRRPGGSGVPGGRTRGRRPFAGRAPAVPAAPSAPSDTGTDATAEELERARQVDDEYRRAHNGRPVSIRALKRELGIGQPKAERLRALLDTPAAAAAKPGA
ncbi:hypothetical protein [Streptomyces sp. NPDC046978]|uniref:hypothetical protein n=1 Tax=Streptomyces sp. NPDC046978 TaxID=3154704 RepID=UPI00340728F3